MKSLGQLWCGLFGGHEYVRNANAAGQWTVCMHCGRESPGWKNDAPAYHQTQPRDARQLALLVNPKVVSLTRRRRHAAR